ncbi:MAG: enolase C-terminal domain-like protein [Betaproteobacteria bacterium]
MRIIDIREVSVPLRSTMRNAVFDFSEMTTSVVAVLTDVHRNGQPVIGYAFNSTGRYACGEVMRARMIPRLCQADPQTLLDPSNGLIDPAKALACMMKREKPAGHTERSIAVGTIEVAIWDALAKSLDLPLHVLLAQRYNSGKYLEKVPCYVGGGWYAPDKGLSELSDEIRLRLDEGYTTMKIKVGGATLAEDLQRVDLAIKLLGSADRVAVDANAGFDLQRCWQYAQALSSYGLRWLEEPTDPLDFKLMSELAQVYPHAIATGENLFSTQDVRNLLLFGGLRAGQDILQVDIAQSYGIVQFTKTLDVLKQHSWSRRQVFPHAGNLMTLAAVAGFGLGGCEAYPGVFGPFAGFADDVHIENGLITVSDRPGIGFEGQNALFEIMRRLF